jgi:hypothetical protein
MSSAVPRARALYAEAFTMLARFAPPALRMLSTFLT